MGRHPGTGEAASKRGRVMSDENYERGCVSGCQAEQADKLIRSNICNNYCITLAIVLGVFELMSPDTCSFCIREKSPSMHTQAHLKKLPASLTSRWLNAFLGKMVDYHKGVQ